MSNPESDWGDGLSTSDIAETNKHPRSSLKTIIITIMIAIVMVIIVSIGISSIVNADTEKNINDNTDIPETPIAINPSTTPDISEIPTPIATTPEPIEEPVVVEPDSGHDETPDLDKERYAALSQFLSKFGIAYTNKGSGKDAWLPVLKPMVSDYLYSTLEVMDFDRVTEGILIGSTINKADSMNAFATINYKTPTGSIELELTSIGDGIWIVAEIRG